MMGTGKGEGGTAGRGSQPVGAGSPLTQQMGQEETHSAMYCES